jgi:hypothetical protein
MSQNHLEVMDKIKAIVLARNRTLVIQILGTVLRREVKDFENRYTGRCRLAVTNIVVDCRYKRGLALLLCEVEGVFTFVLWTVSTLLLCRLSFFPCVSTISTPCKPQTTC